jgi:hypothetical protein
LFLRATDNLSRTRFIMISYADTESDEPLYNSHSRSSSRSHSRSKLKDHHVESPTLSLERNLLRSCLRIDGMESSYVIKALKRLRSQSHSHSSPHSHSDDFINSDICLTRELDPIEIEEDEEIIRRLHPSQSHWRDNHSISDKAIHFLLKQMHSSQVASHNPNEADIRKRLQSISHLLDQEQNLLSSLFTGGLSASTHPSTATVSPFESFIAIGDTGGHLHLFPYPAASHSSILSKDSDYDPINCQSCLGHESSIRNIIFSPDERTMLTSGESDEGTFLQWTVL